MTEPMTYGRYLALDQLLTAQHRLSDRHDELLVIIVHQTKELWLKQIVAELIPAKALVRNGQLTEAYKNLARVSRIQAVMTASWDVLATMTPADYTRFREHVLTVSRIIGGKRGTGGSAGVAYLEATVAKRAFPELWSLRGLL